MLILVSGVIRRYPVTEPLLALVLGALLGPAVIGVLVIPEEIRTPLLLEGTRLLLAVSLIGVALHFPVRDLRSLARPVALMVLLVMPLAAAVTRALGALLLGLPVALAALLGACLSPTDPVLASGVVTGRPAEKALPGRLRKVITEESGFNDGLALPLVLIALAPALGKAASGEIGKAAYQVVVGALVGAALGWLAGRAVRHVEEQDEVESPWSSSSRCCSRWRSSASSDSSRPTACWRSSLPGCSTTPPSASATARSRTRSTRRSTAT